MCKRWIPTRKKDKGGDPMANIHDITRNEWMLKGPLAKRGYD